MNTRVESIDIIYHLSDGTTLENKSLAGYDLHWEEREIDGQKQERAVLETHWKDIDHD